MRDDLSIIKFLQSLHDRIEDTDDSSFDNTIIQFFEAPHDNATLTAQILAYVNGANIPMSPQDNETLTALINARVTDPATLTWGGYDGSNVYWNAGWAWGYGGAYKGYQSALSFDGVSNYVQLATGAVTSALNSNSWTIEFQAYYSNINAGIIWGPKGATNARLLGSAWGSNSIGIVQENVAVINAGLPIILNQWGHFAFTYDGTNVRGYKNGVLGFTQAYAFTAPYSGAYSINSPTISEQVTMDDLCIWNVARTQTQIQDNMRKQLTGFETGLVGYWKFDEGRGLTAYDSTPNHNDGTLNGPTWITY